MKSICQYRCIELQIEIRLIGFNAAKYGSSRIRYNPNRHRFSNSMQPQCDGIAFQLGRVIEITEFDVDFEDHLVIKDNIVISTGVILQFSQIAHGMKAYWTDLKLNVSSFK